MLGTLTTCFLQPEPTGYRGNWRWSYESTNIKIQKFIEKIGLHDFWYNDSIIFHVCKCLLDWYALNILEYIQGITWHFLIHIWIHFLAPSNKGKGCVLCQNVQNIFNQEQKFGPKIWDWSTVLFCLSAHIHKRKLLLYITSRVERELIKLKWLRD